MKTGGTPVSGNLLIWQNCGSTIKSLVSGNHQIYGHNMPQYIRPVDQFMGLNSAVSVSQRSRFTAVFEAMTVIVEIVSGAGIKNQTHLPDNSIDISNLYIYIDVFIYVL